MSRQKKGKMLESFRRLQRCRRLVDWEDYHNAFKQELLSIVFEVDLSSDRAGDDDIEDPAPGSDEEDAEEDRMDNQTKQDQYDAILSYFDKNWFTEEWIRK